ncbi:hypothetical protein E4U55_007130 [Claviceps digitariae]|nr:hypothetical protein E4U55_007130 [Claviceps digitariae]
MYFFSSTALATVALLAHQTLAQGATPGCGVGPSPNNHSPWYKGPCDQKGNTWTCFNNSLVTINDDNTFMLAVPTIETSISLSCNSTGTSDTTSYFYYCGAGKQSLFVAPCTNPIVNNIGDAINE